VSRATVTGRFLDDHYLDQPFTGTTRRNSTIQFVHRGPARVGAIALLVEDVTNAGQMLDLTTGALADSVIPQPRP
jgi:hypothetical protein